jgi:hypothetical protein
MGLEELGTFARFILRLAYQPIAYVLAMPVMSSCNLSKTGSYVDDEIGFDLVS